MANRDKFVTGLIAGAIIGAVAGLLLAPKTGKETRHVIADRARELSQKLRRGRGAEETTDHHVEPLLSS